MSQTCRHVLEHLQQHVLSLVDEFGSLHHQFPQTQVSVQDGADEPALKMPLYRLYLHERRQQPCNGVVTKTFSIRRFEEE